MLKRIVSILALSSVLFGQNPQSSTTIAQPADVKYNNGVGLGYRVTKSSGLNVAVSSGMVQCVDQWIDYAGGTLSLTDNAVNYVVLDPTQDCAPVVILGSALSQGTFWIAKVTTASGAIPDGGIEYARTGVAISQVNSTSGSGGSSGAGGGANATGNEIINGCLVAYTGTGLVFRVSACDYRIAGTKYHSGQTDVTLAAADPTDPRIDDIIVNTSAVATSVAGTPAAVPVAPTLDPSTQLQLTGQGITVDAGATTPTGLTSLSIYDDTATPPWTCAVSSNLNCASASNTYNSGADDIEATTAVATNNFTLTKPSGTIALNSYDTLVFYIRSKANWANAKTLNIFWLNGTATVGGSVALRTGLLGFSSAITGTYQQIVIPLSSFGAGSTAVNKLKVAVAGGGGSIGFYVASVSLQSGTGGTSSNSVACSQMPALLGDVTTPGASCTTTIPAASVGNAKLTNSSITVNGTTCTLGSSCAPAGSGAVGTTGSPATGNLAKFSGAASITNGDISGDCTTSGSLAIICTKTNGSAFATVATSGSASDLGSGTLAIGRGGTGTGSTLTGLVRGSGSAFTAAELSGDASTSGSNAVTVAKVNGISYSATAAAHSVEVITTANTTATAKTVPDCTDASGNHLNYTQSTDAFSCGTTASASGSVTSVATTSPITGGTITGTGTIACAGCVTSSSPGVGIAHFAGSTQAVTSSAVDLSGADATGTIAAARMPALTGDVTTSAGAVATTLGSTFKKRGISFSYGDPAGSALATGSTSTSYVTVPFGCTISAYNLLVDAGTITVKFWKKATGTAIPTSSDSISTSGVSISSGTAIHSTTVSDFTSTTVTANDIMAMNIITVSTAKYVNAVLECDQ